MTPQFKTISLVREGGKSRLQIERPDVLNALNGDVLEELKAAVTLLASDKTTHVVLLSGAGEKAFVAGADIKFMRGLTSNQAREFSQKGNEIFLALQKLPQIVIAKVQGFALGGGLELALSADFIVASTQARFGLPEVSLGLIPGFGGTQRLARRIGLCKAIEWVSTAEKFSAEKAFTAGLVNHVVAPQELNDFTESLIDKILRNGPHAVRAAKVACTLGLEAPMSTAIELESSLFGLRFQTAEANEGLGAFVEKRTANFSTT